MRGRARPVVFAIAFAVACSDPATAPLKAPAPSASAIAQAAAASADAPATSSAIAATPEAEPEPPPIAAPSPPIQLATGGKDAVHSQAGMVTSVEANATRAGIKVLEEGGNAIDAAVAVGYALAVTHPSAGNIGGGGFMIVRLASGESYAIDFREAAPAAATTEKVLAEVKAGAFGYASVAVPGTVAGLNLARERFGKKKLAEDIAPAIKLAKDGHKLSPRAALSLKAQWDKLKHDPEARKIWGKKKDAFKEGDRVVQKDLARTLQAIAEHGDAGFYEGPVAEKIEAAMKKNGGDVTKADLAAYKAKIREPLTVQYRGFTVETMPPPSMGGIAVAQMLVQLERVDSHTESTESAHGLHLFVEAAKRAYVDRRLVGADPDFYGDKVPPNFVSRLLSGKYIVGRKPAIDPQKATLVSTLAASGAKESPETTHYSVVDKDGNAVSCTVTLSASFGAKIVPAGTGVLFSNALGAFSPSGVNEAAAGKRMASSMSPTIVSRDGKVEIVIGSPGGDTIPNTVTQVLRSLIDDRLTVDKAVKRGRIHHQLEPDAIRTEIGRDIPENVKKALTSMGHTITPSIIPLGDVKAIVRDPTTGESWAYADTREGGLAMAETKGKPKKK
ncbi:MAG: gamma-glutamyltransferase [Polyangiaceae bacterium]|nr:gamma-glutamyltransferase [Polyangiaceae bacterium]